MKNKILLFAIALMFAACSSDEAKAEIENVPQVNCKCGTVQNWQYFNVAGHVMTSYDVKNDCTGEVKHFENAGTYHNGDKKCE